MARSIDPTAPLRAKYELKEVLGRSQAFATVLKTITMVAGLEVAVLLTGESGTGKSQIARIIHVNSSRQKHPYLELNCAALPEGLIENELFGAVAGGHSGAAKAVEGKVEAADGGTLFLDEIGELPLGAQAKLLQFLQSGLYYPLGASTPKKSNVRIIAATNVNLEQAVREKQFREDLYYRIKIFPVQLPALRERVEDIPVLARHFCREVCRKHGFYQLALPISTIKELGALIWPGNIRQLAHSIEVACIRAVCEEKTEIPPDYFFSTADEKLSESGSHSTFQEATNSFQKNFLQSCLDEMGWNITRTAKRLDLSRAHVHNLIRSFELRQQISQDRSLWQ